MTGLSADSLTIGYSDTNILNDVSATLPKGKITALIGPNGCGKSTLLKSLSGLLTPRSGQVLLGEQQMQGISHRSRAKYLALLPQSQALPQGVSVKEVVAYGRSPYTGFWGNLTANDWDIVNRAMNVTGVSDMADKPITTLSGGQVQRVWLALTLAQDSEIILLDEPTTYLDLHHQVSLMKLMRELQLQGKTVVTVLHDINQACRYCDFLFVMKAGSIVTQGTPLEIMTPSLLREVFELDAEIHLDPVAHTPMCVIR